MTDIFDMPKQTLVINPGELWKFADRDKTKDVTQVQWHPYFIVSTSSSRIIALPISHNIKGGLPFFTCDYAGKVDLCFIGIDNVYYIHKDDINKGKFTGYTYNEDTLNFFRKLLCNNINSISNETELAEYRKDFFAHFGAMPISSKDDVVHTTPTEPSVVTQPAATKVDKVDAKIENVESSDVSSEISPEIMEKIENNEMSIAEVAKQLGMTYAQAMYRVNLKRQNFKFDMGKQYSLADVYTLFNNKMHRSKEYAKARGLKEKQACIYKDIGKICTIPGYNLEDSPNVIYKFVYAALRYDKDVVAACYGLPMSDITIRLKKIRDALEAKYAN